MYLVMAEFHFAATPTAGDQPSLLKLLQNLINVICADTEVDFFIYFYLLATIQTKETSCHVIQWI